MESKFTILPEIDPAEFAKLYEMLEKIKIPVKASNAVGRSKFAEKHRACAWGQSFHFTKKVINEKSVMAKKYPEINAEIIRIAKMIGDPVGHRFTSIYMNRNIQCDPHRDSSNHGDLIIVSFGEYTGGELFIEGEHASAKYRPIKFDGTHNTHWNPKDLVGTKYSLVFYSHKAIIKAMGDRGYMN